MFGRSKGLDLSMADSNYAPAINPNTLAPQAATGAKPQPKEPKPVKPKQPKQRIPSEPKPPTIINNYYYVQPSSPLPSQPQNLSPVIDPRYSVNPEQRIRHSHNRPPQQAQQAQQPQQRHYSSNISQPHQYPNEQRRSSAHSDYDSFVRLAKSRNASGSSSPLKGTHNAHSSIYESVSLFSSDSGRKSNSENLFLKSKMEARLPEIDFVDDYNSERASRAVNLIGVLSKISDNDISVHNERLYEIFHRLSRGNDAIGIHLLADILCDPFEPAGRLPFKNKSVELIMNTFTSSGELNFRNFIKLSKFSKGCLVSFMFHDRDRSHTLSFTEFTRALETNAMVCPDELLAKLFQKSENIDFEGYIVGIIAIRSWERGRTR